MAIISQIIIAEILMTLTSVVALLLWHVTLPLTSERGPALPYWILRFVSVLQLVPVVYVLVQISIRSRHFVNDSIWKPNFQMTGKMNRIFLVLGICWVVKIAYSLMKHMKSRSFWDDMLHSNEPETDAVVLEELLYVRQQLHIKEEIALYRNELMQSPMVTGLFHHSIVLPPCRYTRENLRVIFYHELLHYKSHDIFYKYCCVAAGFFQPVEVSRLLLRKLGVWSEHYCDERAIAAVGGCGGREAWEYYFENILDIMGAVPVLEDNEYVFSMLCEDESSLDRRLEYMSQCIKRKHRKKMASVLLAAVFVVCGVIPTYGAGIGMAKLNDFAYVNTSVGMDYTADALDTFDSADAEIIYVPAGEDTEEFETVYPDNDGIMLLYDSGTVYQESWTISPGVRHVTSQMSIQSGQSITISCTPSPSGISYRYGIVDGSGNQWYVSASAGSSYAFPVSTTAKYRVFVTNMGSENISVGVSFTYS